MRYIKRYSVFESSDNSELLSNIKDICLELEDDGFSIKFVLKDAIDHAIVIEKKTHSSSLPGYEDLIGYIRVAYKYAEVEEVVNRIKEYLGDKFISSSFIKRRGNGKWIIYDTPDEVDDNVVGIKIKYRK